MSLSLLERSGSHVGSAERPLDRRTVLMAAVGGTASAALARPGRRARAQATPDASPAAESVTYEIPGEGIFPESVAYDARAETFYVGNSEDGTIYRGDLATGVVEPFLAGGEDGRTAVTGLKVDADGRLIACGRLTGRIFVYDTASGVLLARLTSGRDEGTLVNDAVIASDGVAYVTDSYRPVLYRVDLTALPIGPEATPPASVPEQEAEVFLEFTGSPFAYDAEEVNANGLVASADGTALLIIKFNTGQLYRVDLETGEVAEAPLDGGDLLGVGGMALDGTTLWCVRDRRQELIRVELDEALTRGTVVGVSTDPTFDYPTNLALIGDGTALVANHQLEEEGAPPRSFTVSRVALPE